MSTITSPPTAHKDQQLPASAKENHQKALADIEVQQSALRERIASKLADKATLQAVHDSLRKRGEDGKV